jgi:type IV secretion system protein VirB3
MRKDALFRGCTRPPMFLGVPYMPFFICVGGCFLLAVYFSFFILFLIPVIIFIMRTMAKRDEMIFRLIGLRLQFRTRVKNIPENDGMWVFTPNSYRGDKQER